MLKVKPYPYQDEAIDFALDRGNLLIAYGMGLGKTLVQMAICEELLGTGESTLNAIVVPASLKWQWAQALVWGTDVQTREIVLKPRTKNPQRIVVPARHHAVVIDGAKEKRDREYAYIREYRPDYVILGYDQVVNDWRFVKAMKPDLIALDEATAIKSFEAERSKVIKEWDAPFRYALTGTPIDNRPEELFSIMEWLDPTELGRFDTFDRVYISRDGYGRPKRYKNLDVLHTKTKRFVARKTRFDPEVAPFMPKDFHKEFYVSLTGQAKKMYEEIALELVDALSDLTGFGGFDVAAYYSGDKGGGSSEQGDAMARYGALAMLCDHPMLLLESAKKFEEFMEGEGDVPPQGSAYAFSLLQDGRLDWITKKTMSPKFEAVLEHILDIADEREENKQILFSFSKGILYMLKARLAKEGVKAVTFTGDDTQDLKEAAKQSFKRDPKVRVFLSSDAGGMGVDLPEANYLFNYNHPWSAGKADQRNSRHIRAGSKWDEVWVLNYLTPGSVEDWKYQVLDLKRRVGSAIIDGAPTQKGVINFDVASLLVYLTENALG